MLPQVGSNSMAHVEDSAAKKYLISNNDFCFWYHKITQIIKNEMTITNQFLRWVEYEFL